MQRPRKHQPLPYRMGPDPRPFLAAVVCLPQERGKEPEPFYQEAEIQAAYLSTTSPGIGQPPVDMMHLDMTRTSMTIGRSEESLPNTTFEGIEIDRDHKLGGDDASPPETDPNLSSSEGHPTSASSVPSKRHNASIKVEEANPLGYNADPQASERGSYSAAKTVEDMDEDREDDLSTPEPKSSKNSLSINHQEMPNLIE